MRNHPDLSGHRVAAQDVSQTLEGKVRFSPVKAGWFFTMLAGAVVGGLATATVGAVLLFIVSTGIVLLLGHSLGSHRKLIHDSYQCPKGIEYLFVYLGVQVGLAGPLGLMRQHELRDYAQRLPDCHPYLRHGERFWKDAYWQLLCELRLANPPAVRIEDRVAKDRFYRFLEVTWMWQHLPWALLFFAWGGWAFVFWGVCARVVAGVFGHWIIGYFAHNHGVMHHLVEGAAVQGHNVPFTWLLTMGESWHNNHHAYPGSARLGLHAGEFDPGWWVLMAMRRAGLAWKIRTPGDLPFRPELHRVDMKTPIRMERDDEIVLSVPRGPLSLPQIQWLVGKAVRVRVDPWAERLELWRKGTRLRGAPALLEAILLRAGSWSLVARSLMPAALAFEYLRYRWDLE